MVDDQAAPDEIILVRGHGELQVGYVHVGRVIRRDSLIGRLVEKFPLDRRRGARPRRAVGCQDIARRARGDELHGVRSVAENDVFGRERGRASAPVGDGDCAGQGDVGRRAARGGQRRRGRDVSHRAAAARRGYLDCAGRIRNCDAGSGRQGSHLKGRAVAYQELAVGRFPAELQAAAPDGDFVVGHYLSALLSRRSKILPSMSLISFMPSANSSFRT